MRDGLDWQTAKSGLAGLLGPPFVWFLLFFAVPMLVVWAYSFGSNVGVAAIEISGTFSNYARALEPLYLRILGKSLAFAALATLICLVIGFPVALALIFGREWFME